MRHTRTSIINTALMRVGAQGVTAAFQDAPAAQTAAAAYDRCLAYCLSLHPWQFALKHVALARGAETPPPGWRFSWPLPADCLRVVDAVHTGPEGEHGMAWSLAGGSLLTDAPAVRIVYVSADPTDVPHAFADALAWRVALEISPYVQQGGGSARDYLEMFERALDRARVENDLQSGPGGFRGLPRQRAGRSAFLAERMVW